MKSRLDLRVFALLAGAALLSTSAMASPLAEAVVTRTQTVQYSATAAATPVGATELYEKLHAAASKVCSDEGTGFASRYMETSYAECMNKALTKAVADVGSPVLTAVHLQNTYMKTASVQKDAMTVAQR